MIRRTKFARTARHPRLAARRVTIVAIPKAFAGHAGVIQRNAIESWTRLAPRPQVLLMGDDPGVAEFAAELNIEHVPKIARNENGTPLVSDALAQARRRAEEPLICYVNADIVFLSDFSRAIARISAAPLERFLMIGRRMDCDITTPIDFVDDWESTTRELARTRGTLASRLCKDYFVFPKDEFASMPPFAVGRANWDNWMVYHAHESGMPVIDATRSILAVHQNHDYGHIAGGRREAYTTGSEANRNLQLSGGRRWIKGSAANWVLTPKELRRARMRLPAVQFLADLGRIARLSWSIRAE